jgi:hypothetical protein
MYCTSSAAEFSMDKSMKATHAISMHYDSYERGPN